MRAAKSGDTLRVRELLAAGAAPGSFDETPRSDAPSGFERGHGSALTYALEEGHENAALALIEADSVGATFTDDLLTLAIQAGLAGAVRALLARGAKIQRGQLGRAIMANRADLVDILCAAGAAVVLRGSGHPAAFAPVAPLALAIELGFAECSAVLRAHGAPEPTPAVLAATAAARFRNYFV